MKAVKVTSAPLLAVGGVVVDSVPAPVKDFGIAVFGVHDKTALITGTAILLAAYAWMVGVVAMRSWRLALGAQGAWTGSRGQPLEHGLPLEQLHRDERLAIVLFDLVNGADVGMIQGGGGLGFALQQAQRRRGVGQLLRQELERHPPAELEILGLIHHAHAPAADHRHDAVVGHLLPDQSRWFGYRLGCRSSRRRSPRLHPLGGDQESVASSGQGFDVPGIVGGVAESSAEGTDGHVDAVVEINDRVVGPEPLLDFLPGGEAPIVLDQQPQDPERLLPKDDTLAPALGSG